MPATYTHEFKTPAFTGKATLNTGLFIDGEWVDPVEGGKHECVIHHCFT